MIITCGIHELTTSCKGCMCHEMEMRFGSLHKGHCAECGCPKTKEAFDTDFAAKEGS